MSVHKLIYTMQPTLGYDASVRFTTTVLWAISNLSIVYIAAALLINEKRLAAGAKLSLRLAIVFIATLILMRILEELFPDCLLEFRIASESLRVLNSAAIAVFFFFFREIAKGRKRLRRAVNLVLLPVVLLAIINMRSLYHYYLFLKEGIVFRPGFQAEVIAGIAFLIAYTFAVNFLFVLFSEYKKENY
ncbi:hypothetical protein MROS_0993 [Melioribacter roseus P3M-2]|uniref:Uncharacterized protein n=1 Tax=Melioribacter roseus (strain DSM 23840 / JCM 17771 / VKM B-2668 / P3M-2) TaxID=1191523 RepID=I6ZQ87_MELRP|nr:hypothetical protein [Melioribacter roseus]AFN74234.1 hypothetical protein MROS_0993 [Melioribacter roseus P3M-2]